MVCQSSSSRTENPKMLTNSNNIGQKYRALSAKWVSSSNLTSLGRRMMMVLAVILCILAVASGAVAAVETQSTDRELFDDEMASENGTAISNTSEPVENDSEGSIQTEEGDDNIEVGVAVSPPQDRGSFASDGTVDIWVGASTFGDIPEAIEDETLNVTIEDPDGSVDDFQVETDANGSAHLAYDLADRADGEYEIDVERADGDEQTSIKFDAGPTVDIMTNRDSGIFIDEETTISALVRNGEFAESGEEVEISIEDPDGNSVLETTSVSDDEGFVEEPFTPEEAGAYNVEISLANGENSDSTSKQATEVTLASDFAFEEVISGEEAVYGGYLRGADGQLENTEFNLTFFEDFDRTELISQENVTTDEQGFFLVFYEVPEDLDTDLMHLDAETSDGTPIHVRYDSLFLNELPEDDDPEPEPEPEVTLDASVDTGDVAGFDDSTAPGGEVVIDIEAEENGEPIVDEEVDIVFDWDGFDSPPLFATTVTTDDQGTATTTMTVPEDALDNVQPNGQAEIEFNDTFFSDSMNLRIEENHISTIHTDMAVGETGTFEIEIEDQLTEEPVEDVPVQFTTLHTGYKIDTIDTGELISDADGTDMTEINVPVDIGPSYFSNNQVHQYRSPSANTLSFADHPGTLTVETEADDDDESRQVAAPGETVTLDFDTESDEVASGIVFADVFSTPQGSFGTEITSDETVTLEIPTWLEDGQQIALSLWGADGDLPFYEDEVFIDIEEPEGVVADFDITTPPVDPIVGVELTFDASDSVATEGNLTYEWEFGDGTELETDDPVVNHTYDSSGDVTVELTVTDEANESDTTTESITIKDATKITGELTHFDGEPAANNTVVAFEAENEVTEGLALTDENGEFELFAPKPVDEEAGDLTIAYAQGDFLEESTDDLSELDVFPRDERVDLFAIDVVDRDDDPVEIGETTLPQGYVVNPIVVDEGEPVEDALLVHTHINDETGAEIDWGEPTNEDGQGLTSGEPGLELNGTVEVAAWAPDSDFDDEPDAVRELDVTEDTEFELELSAVPPEAALEAPEEVEIGDTFELNANGSTDDVGIESFNFTITDEDGEVVFTEQTTGDNPNVSTNLSESGLYTADVEVENEDGLTDEAEVEILVLDQQPNLVATVEAQDEQRIEDNVNANITVANDGNASITDPVEVSATVTGSSFETDEVVAENTTLVIEDELAPGENVTKQVTFDTTTADDERIVGDVLIDVEADPDDNIDEITTATNTDETTVEVTFANLVAAANAPSFVVEGADTTFRSFIRNTGTANSSASNATVSVTNETNETVFEDEDVHIDQLEPDNQQRTLFNESFDEGEYELTVDVEDELFPENTTDTTTFEVEEYNLTTVEDATDVPTQTQAGLNSTVVFGFETNAQEEVNATLDASDADELKLSDGSESKTVTVDPETDRTNLVSYDVQGSEASDDAELEFNVSDTLDGIEESETVSETTNVTVQTETITNESSTTLTEGASEVETTLEAFANNDTTDQELEVTIQGGTEGRTLQGLGYLVEYPYGCVEQTTSAFLGALNTDEYYDDRDGDVTPGQQDDINGSIEEGIERLQPDGLRGQQDDGSWNQWGREGQAGQSYFSSYALLGISSVENNDVHGELNEENLNTVDFDEAVEWIADDNWNQPDGYLYDEPASTGFTLVALDEAAATNELDAETEETLTEIYADAAAELYDSQENVSEGVAWNEENPRSTALAVHGLQLAVEDGAYEKRDDLNETALNETIDEGVDWLEATQNTDGSWGDGEYSPSSWFNGVGDKSETTSAALMALDETGAEAGDEAILDGTDYLIDVYESDGSWGYPRATQASINALNELTPGAANRTVDITIDVENGDERTFEDVSVNDTAQTSTVSLDNEELGEILDDTEEGEITVEIDAANGGDGMVIVAAEVTQDVETPALGGDDE